MILVVCAVARELAGLAAREGVEIVACGVGPVEAAAATARALATANYAAVVNAGIGGVFPGRGDVGDAFLIVRESLAGLGIEGGAPLTLPDGIRLVADVHADETLVARITKPDANGLERGATLRVGRGLTVTEVTATGETAERHLARYGADVESMEGFAVLRAASVARVPALEVRGISNLVGDRALARWDFARGARATVRALDIVLDRLAPERAALP